MSEKTITVIPATKITAENRAQYHQLRVAAYCRVSTDEDEQLNSYQVQIAYYTDLINNNKEWSLVNIFADEGISGTQMKKRTQFNRMMRMCRKKQIDLILCKSVSRFARNTVDCLESVRELKSLGIGVIFEKENINTLIMPSEFFISLHGSFAQAESESISKNVSWGIEKAFREGKVRYNYQYFLGYRKGADGKPEIVPEEAEIVRKIYTMFLDGMSMKNIAAELNRQGLPTCRGTGQWEQSRVRYIISSEKYVGDAMLQKFYTVDCLTHKRVKNNGERTKYLVTNAHPAIIDRETYNRVQQELARRSSKRKVSDKCVTEQGKYSSKYALTEIMICGECGTPYRRVVWNVHGRKQPMWRCINRLDYGSKYCHHSPSMHEGKLHSAILRALNDFYNEGKDVIQNMQYNGASVLSDLGDSEIVRIEQRLKEMDTARDQMVRLIASGTVGEDSFDSELQKLFDEEINLSAKLESLKVQSKTPQVQQEKIDVMIERFNQDCGRLTEFDDVLIRKAIECIKVMSKTEIIVIFRGGYEVKVEVEK
ncbi:MAG: recombinase family protein [Ruminococcus sp.]|nr:recombinase family protein [Ruminococcus sp.]